VINKVLIVCSGNSPDGSNFDFERHHTFIYEQFVILKNLGVEFDYFYIKSKGIIGYIKSWHSLWVYLKKNKYTLIHAHYGLSGFIAVMQPHNKTLITFHGSDINQKKTRLISNLACLMADYSIFVSPFLYEKLYIRPRDKYSVIPCGIDLNTFFPLDKIEARRKMNLKEDKKYVLFSSYFLNPAKNYKLAEKAMSLVPNAELLELKNKSREEVNLLLNAVDVLLLTSQHEGSPQVVKEAMACNCPVVSTNVGDVKTIFNNTNYCYVCDNRPEEIAERINSLLKTPVRTKGAESISLYDNKIISEKVLNIYRRFGITGNYQQCKNGLWDTTVPGIRFDENGISNYCHIHETLMNTFVRGNEGKTRWSSLLLKIKNKGEGKKYDCVIGISGGTDSSFLMHLAVKWGLRPLAVNLDNGWSSDISVRNIRKITTALNIDLETFVIEYEEVKDILRSQMLAGLPWIDGPTDYAIKSILYKIAKREGIKYILTGSDFRSEGKQPTEWTYTDKRQILRIHKRFGRYNLKTFPLISFSELFYLGYICNIKTIAPYNYIDYQKKIAQKLLIDTYKWEYYGGHHHENLFTKFAITYWMPEKFNIDKRLITLSAQIVSGEISRDEGLKILEGPSCDISKIEEEKAYVIKKLGLSESEFYQIWNSPNKSFRDYPSNYPIIKHFSRFIIPVISLFLPQKPKIFFEMEGRAI
jgi:N-acetyl sugar amidotransferase